VNWFYELLRNHVLVNALVAWVIAQIIKVLINTAVNRRFNFFCLFGDGGMPSGHSATVTALAPPAPSSMASAPFHLQSQLSSRSL
jgi:acid phosphatase family membrane protein YuiD